MVQSDATLDATFNLFLFLTFRSGGQDSDKDQVCILKRDYGHGNANISRRCISALVDRRWSQDCFFGANRTILPARRKFPWWFKSYYLRSELNSPNFDILTFVDSFIFRESPYRKTPKFDRIFCKSASFLFNLAMYSTNREKEFHVVVDSKAHWHNFFNW